MMMKILAVLSGLLVSNLVLAADNEPKDAAAFQAIKDKHIALIQERLQMVQTNLSCTQAAADMAALKTCKETAKQQHAALQAKEKELIAEKKAKRGQTK